jgi:hypothetical protein
VILQSTLRQLLGNTSQAWTSQFVWLGDDSEDCEQVVGEISVEVFENEIEPHYKGLDDDLHTSACDVDCSDKKLHDRVALLPPLVSSKQIRYEDLREPSSAEGSKLSQ